MLGYHPLSAAPISALETEGPAVADPFAKLVDQPTAEPVWVLRFGSQQPATVTTPNTDVVVDLSWLQLEIPA